MASLEAEPRGPAGTRALLALVLSSEWRKGAVVSSLPYLYLLTLGVAIGVIEPDLLFGSGSIANRAALVAPLALVAFGQSLALFTRGIDLSVGGIVSLTTALVATHLNAVGLPLLLAEVVGVLLIGVAAGALNGIIVAITGLQPFIVTLATWSIWSGVAFGVLPVDGGTPSPKLLNGLAGEGLGVPAPVWMIVVLFLAWVWLRRTRFITDLLAIGSDENRARLIGVPLIRRRIEAYACSGGLAAAAGLWVVALTSTGSPSAGDEYILSSVAAVVLGGTSIFGGRGSAANSIVGAFVFLMIPDMVFALRLASFWSVFLQGLLLVLVVVGNSILSRRLEG